jgi:hypothetical protein
LVAYAPSSGDYCTIYRLANSAGEPFLYHLCGTTRFYWIRFFTFFLSGFGVDALNFTSTEIFTGGISPSADGDKGYSPLTSTAFSEEKAAQKNFYHRVRFHGRCLRFHENCPPFREGFVKSIPFLPRYPPSPVGGTI